MSALSRISPRVRVRDSVSIVYRIAPGGYSWIWPLQSIRICTRTRIHSNKEITANLPNWYSAQCWRPVTYAQIWASYSALYRFGRLSEITTRIRENYGYSQISSDVTIRLYRFRSISIRFFDQQFDLDSIWFQFFYDLHTSVDQTRFVCGRVGTAVLRCWPPTKLSPHRWRPYPGIAPGGYSIHYTNTITNPYPGANPG